MINAFISDFVVERKRERFLALALTPMFRGEVIAELIEGGTWIDPRLRVELQKHQRATC